MCFVGARGQIFESEGGAYRVDGEIRRGQRPKTMFSVISGD